MTIMMAGTAIAGGLTTIFGGNAEAAAAKQRNEALYKNWVANNIKNSIGNAREQFQAAYQFGQQLKRNQAIAEAAYKTQYDAKENLRNITTFQQTQLAKQKAQLSATLKNSVLTRGVSKSSGLYNALAVTQALDALNNSTQIAENHRIQNQNIDKQFSAQLSQQTGNIFMPNVAGYAEGPNFESFDSTGSMIAGGLQIAGAVGGLGYGALTKGTPTNVPVPGQPGG